MVRRNDIRDTDMSLRFKHGNQTIFLFVSSVEPFHRVRQELLGILQERYPDGITTSVMPPKKTDLPNDASQLRFGVLKNKLDYRRGWKPLVMSEDDTPVDKGLEDNMIIAFAVAGEDAEDADDVAFEVEFPSYEEEAGNARE
ncbi:hypothetical protein F4861DRAFT_105878 [Xylaria intraflava]|nr:hypothetical protein F4861DRAFT_105878 [Xylaria intraflava]